MIACQIAGRHRFHTVTLGLVSPPPSHDLVTVEGQPFVLDDTTITLVPTPRPTPGTVSLIGPGPDAGLARLKQP